MTKWTEPRTFVDEETVTAAAIQTHFADNMKYLHKFERCHVYGKNDLEVKNDQWETMRWDAELFDSNSMHRVRRKNQRINFNQNGIYLVIFKVDYESHALGTRYVMLRKNSDQEESGGQHLGTWTKASINGYRTTVHATRVVKADQNDHINAFTKQTSGDRIRVISGRSTTFLQAIQLAG